MGSFIDEDDLVCPVCGHTGLLPDGDLEYVCPSCDSTVYPFDNDEDEEYDDLDYEDEDGLDDLEDDEYLEEEEEEEGKSSTDFDPYKFDEE